MMSGKRRISSSSAESYKGSPPKAQRFRTPGMTDSVAKIHPGDAEGQQLVVADDEIADWPAPRSQLLAARAFIEECVEGQHLTLLVPDKDGSCSSMKLIFIHWDIDEFSMVADGLSSGKILHETLLHLGHPPSLIKAHFLSKCASIFHASEKENMESYQATRIIVMDQGSRGSPPLVAPSTSRDTPQPVKVLIIDHHESSHFPSNALVATGCRATPVPTSSMMTYSVCSPLIQSAPKRDMCASYAVLGVFGDLGVNSVKFGEGPWPREFEGVAKREKKSVLGKVVGLVNAPRRTDVFNGTLRNCRLFNCCC
jgi:hypothetical protein